MYLVHDRGLHPGGILVTLNPEPFSCRYGSFGRRLEELNPVSLRERQGIDAETLLPIDSEEVTER